MALYKPFICGILATTLPMCQVTRSVTSYHQNGQAATMQFAKMSLNTRFWGIEGVLEGYSSVFLAKQ